MRSWAHQRDCSCNQVVPYAGDAFGTVKRLSRLCCQSSYIIHAPYFYLGVLYYRYHCIYTHSGNAHVSENIQPMPPRVTGRELENENNMQKPRRTTQVRNHVPVGGPHQRVGGRCDYLRQQGLGSRLAGSRVVADDFPEPPKPRTPAAFDCAGPVVCTAMSCWAVRSTQVPPAALPADHHRPEHQKVRVRGRGRLVWLGEYCM